MFRVLTAAAYAFVFTVNSVAVMWLVARFIQFAAEHGRIIRYDNGLAWPIDNTSLMTFSAITALLFLLNAIATLRMIR